MVPVRRTGVAVAAVVVLLVGAGVDAVGRDARSLGERCETIHHASDVRRAQVHEGIGPVVAVVGDSYAQGLGLEDSRRSWPARLPGRVVVDGFSGSGFSSEASRCPGVDYGSRLDRALAVHPDLVVFEGGLNDVDVSPTRVTRSATELLARLDGVPAVVVGPPAAPRRAGGAAHVDALLAEVAAAAGVPYVRTLSWRLDYLPDRLHLTVAGHREFGDRVAAALADLGWLSVPD
jgi:acyl-CoA thioesterase-1